MDILERITEFRDVDKRNEILDRAGLVIAIFFADPASNKELIEGVIPKSVLNESRLSKKEPDQSGHYYFYPLDGFDKNESLIYWQLKTPTGEIIISINEIISLRSEIAMAYVIARVGFIPNLDLLNIKTHSSK